LRFDQPNENVNYTYDSAWNPYSMCGTICYVTSATYTALNQPDLRSLGNGLSQDWSYSSPMQRLSQIQVGSLFTRSYTYDNVGNVNSITDPQWPQTQHFSRQRLGLYLECRQHAGEHEQ
jgi:hypothetical protein